MSALTIRPPNSVHEKIKELAERDNISVNQFIASAAAEKMASVMTLDFLKSEAAKGRRSDFEHYMSRVPDAPAAEGDERFHVGMSVTGEAALSCGGAGTRVALTPRVLHFDTQLCMLNLIRRLGDVTSTRYGSRFHQHPRKGTATRFNRPGRRSARP